MALFGKKAAPDAPNSNAAPAAGVQANASASTPFDAFDLSDATSTTATPTTATPVASMDFDMMPPAAASPATNANASSNADGFDPDDIFNMSGASATVVAPSPPSVTIMDGPPLPATGPAPVMSAAPHASFTPDVSAIPESVTETFEIPSSNVLSYDGPSYAPPAPEPMLPVVPMPGATYSEPVPSLLQKPKVKKKLPILPLALGGLLLLGAGGAAMMFANRSQPEDDSAPAIAPRPSRAPRPDGPRPDGPRPGAPLGVRPGAPKAPVAPATRPLASAPMNARPGQNSAPANAPSADPKVLWQQGADALHRGDYAGARRAWQQISTQNPGNAQIREALTKLAAAEKQKTRALP